MDRRVRAALVGGQAIRYVRFSRPSPISVDGGSVVGAVLRPRVLRAVVS